MQSVLTILLCTMQYFLVNIPVSGRSKISQRSTNSKGGGANLLFFWKLHENETNLADREHAFRAPWIHQCQLSQKIWKYTYPESISSSALRTCNAKNWPGDGDLSWSVHCKDALMQKHRWILTIFTFETRFEKIPIDNYCTSWIGIFWHWWKLKV